MIKHVVMWKLKDNAEGKSKKNNAIKIKKELEDLKNSIPEIKEIEVGINFADSPFSYDIVLISDFENREALDVYKNHPDHLDVAVFVKKIVSERAVVDYEI